jgi:hypothetical protein
MRRGTKLYREEIAKVVKNIVQEKVSCPIFFTSEIAQVPGHNYDNNIQF